MTAAGGPGRDDLEQQVRAVLVRLAAGLAPDRRLAVCDLRPRCDGGRVILRGMISEAAFRAPALEAAAAVPGVEEVDDWLILLPTADLAAWPWLVVQVAVLDLWRHPGSTAEAERVDQALLGTVLRPLRAEGEWLQVQAADGYIGWVAAAGVASLDSSSVRLWQSGRWVLLTETAGLCPAPGAPPFMRALAGSCLPLAGERGIDWLGLLWPGGGEMLLPAAAGRVLPALPYPLRPGRATGTGGAPWPRAALVTGLARGLLGAPYCPGGATPAGFDGAGLVRYAFARHGVALPRDADQQWAAAHPLGPDDDPLPGDLIFFGPAGGPPVDVGLYLGDGGCIHVGPGGVAAVSFDPRETAFDPALAAAVAGYRRVLPPQGLWGEGI